MRIAIISDIHANLPALQAVLEDIAGQHIDSIWCLGDLVNFAGWDNEVIDLIRLTDTLTVQGNHDEGIGHNRADFSFSYTGDAQYRFGLESIRLTNRRITAPNRAYLAALPATITLEYRFAFQQVRLVLTHGSPVSNNDYIQPETTDEILNGLLDVAGADILLMGHTHRPFHRVLLTETENRPRYRHAINAGSVGKPKHGDNQACYVMLEFDQHIRLEDPDILGAHFHFVPYDTEAVIRRLHAEGLGDAYDRFLRTGQ
ncbi:MAG TPA: metallophosphoesterase family protein [Puia sp.]|nr:metallophosphoesterase family protein [Puia sp.]